METQPAARLPLDETALLEGVRAGESRSLEQVYKSFFPAIRHFLILNNGSEQEARDLYQEAIMVLYEKVRRDAAPLNCSISTFLYSVVRNLWLKQLRERNRAPMVADSLHSLADVTADVEAGVEQETLFKNMAHALNQLGEPCKSLIEAFYIEEASMDVLADRFGYSGSDTAKNQKYKCLMRLRRLFFDGQGRGSAL